MNIWFNVKRKIIITICIFLLLVWIPFVWSDWFFGGGEKCLFGNVLQVPISEIVKYVGAFLGGILVAINAILIYERTKEQNRSNNLIAKGQLDTRFKDAAMLLAAGNTSAELSGIHALHQIAIEASKTKDQQDYVKVINDIFITFIKENSVIEYRRNENGEIDFAEIRERIVQKKYITKSIIVLQTIIDKLFKGDDWEMYSKYQKDLSETVLDNIDFVGATFKNTTFQDAELEWANFSSSKSEYLRFTDARLQYTCFSYVQFLFPNFEGAQMNYAKFMNSQLHGAFLQNADFVQADLRNADFWCAHQIEQAIFRNTFWNIKTNFKDTAFQDKTEEELTKIMGNTPDKLDD